jgi:hypothetical protein
MVPAFDDSPPDTAPLFRSGIAPVLVLMTAALCLSFSRVSAQAIWSNGFESGRPCPWSKIYTVETCDGRDNDCDRSIDESCVNGTACTPPAVVASITGAHVVGDGTPESCTEAALDAAIANTGAAAITFDCGSAPHTIVVTSEKAISRDLVIDGGGLITLSGGGTTRILKLDSFFDRDYPLLTLQFLNLVDGYTAALPGTETSSGGAAVFRLGGSLVILDCIFENNVGPSPGQDVAGGAVYSLGIGNTIISGSTFLGNRCSSGGAIGNLHNHLELVNSIVLGNSATGTGGNPGNGGNGGGVYMDGVSQTFHICGSVISDNTANALGGGVFRVSNDGVGPMTIEQTTVSDNVVNDAPTLSQAGGLYLQGLQIVMTDSTVSGNTANSSGGLFVWENPGAQTLDMTNVTIANNHTRASLGAGMSVNQNVTGTLWQVTIAGNSTAGATSFASAINGGHSLVLKNTLIAENTKVFIWENTSCNQLHTGQGANYQWPSENAGGQAEQACAMNTVFSDPLLLGLGDNGGPTETILPGGGSPAIGTSTDCPSADQRGQPRNPVSCTPGATEP